MPFTASKRRLLAGSRDEFGNETPQVVATATATPYPAFPTGPDANGRVVFAGDMSGAKVAGVRWDMSVLTTFTAADCAIQVSPNGVDWETYVTMTQKSAVGSEELYFDMTNNDASPKFWRALIDMTGTPGTSSHVVELMYSQCGPVGPLAPPGRIDVNH